MSDFNDTKVILNELEQLFHRDDDIKDILDIKKMELEIQTQCNNKLKDAKEIIKLMTSELSSKETELKAPSQSEHILNLKKISNKENLVLHTDTLNKNIDLKRHNISKMASTCLSLKERANEFHVSTNMADSRTAYAISLYAKISNITWDYKSSPGHLSGCIGNDSKKELEHFDLDTRQLTSFQLANSLWDLIEKTHHSTSPLADPSFTIIPANTSNTMNNHTINSNHITTSSSATTAMGNLSNYETTTSYIV